MEWLLLARVSGSNPSLVGFRSYSGPKEIPSPRKNASYCLEMRRETEFHAELHFVEGGTNVCFLPAYRAIPTLSALAHRPDFGLSHRLCYVLLPRKLESGRSRRKEGRERVSEGERGCEKSEGNQNGSSAILRNARWIAPKGGRESRRGKTRAVRSGKARARERAAESDVGGEGSREIGRVDVPKAESFQRAYTKASVVRESGTKVERGECSFVKCTFFVEHRGTIPFLTFRSLVLPVC